MGDSSVDRATLPPEAAEGQFAHVMRLPRREDIDEANLEVLHEGGTTGADLLVLDLGDGPIVVKDYDKKGWLLRTVGRVQIMYECWAYRFLGPFPNIPRFIGRIDAMALAMEKIDGVQLTLAADRHERGAVYLERLRGVTEALRERGFCHLDIRGRRNVFVRRDGQIIVLDLEGAIWARPGSFAHRLVRKIIDSTYRSALLKWKAVLTPEALTETDRRDLRRFARLRWLRVYRRKEKRGRGWPEG